LIDLLFIAFTVDDTTMLKAVAKRLVAARVAVGAGTGAAQPMGALNEASLLIPSTESDIVALKTIADGYAVLDEIISDSACDDHFPLGRHTGWKIGATNAAAQASVGFGPFYGPLFQSNIVVGPSPMISLQSMGSFRAVEAELAFTMGDDMPPLSDGRLYSVSDTWARVKAVTPAIEVASSRIDGPLSPPLIVADFALNGCVVLGRQSYRPKNIDTDHLAEATAAIEVNNTEVASSPCSSVLGNPVVALTWLANELNKSNKMTTGIKPYSLIIQQPKKTKHLDHSSSARPLRAPLSFVLPKQCYPDRYLIKINHDNTYIHICRRTTVQGGPRHLGLTREGLGGRTTTHRYTRTAEVDDRKDLRKHIERSSSAAETRCWSIAYVWHEQCIFILFARHCPTKSIVPSTHISRSPVFSPRTAS
jgi:2-keto-4-pentenoate hydratase